MLLVTYVVVHHRAFSVARLPEPEIAQNEQNNDDDADDGEDAVHAILLVRGLKREGLIPPRI